MVSISTFLALLLGASFIIAALFVHSSAASFEMEDMKNVFDAIDAWKSHREDEKCFGLVIRPETFSDGNSKRLSTLFLFFGCFMHF